MAKARSESNATRYEKEILVQLFEEDLEVLKQLGERIPADLLQSVLNPTVKGGLFFIEYKMDFHDALLHILNSELQLVRSKLLKKRIRELIRKFTELENFVGAKSIKFKDSKLPEAKKQTQKNSIRNEVYDQILKIKNEADLSGVSMIPVNWNELPDIFPSVLTSLSNKIPEIKTLIPSPHVLWTLGGMLELVTMLVNHADLTENPEDSEVAFVIAILMKTVTTKPMKIMDEFEDYLKESGNQKSKPHKKSTLQIDGNENSVIAERSKTDQLFQLKIELDDIHPKIWRRVLVHDCTLGELHRVIQQAMGWFDGHLHSFSLGRLYYMPYKELEAGCEGQDEETVYLSSVFTKPKTKLQYEYDFGDGWIHTITFEKMVEPQPRHRYPKCIEGERACPPEDCGGPCGFADMLEILEDRKHPEYKELKEWLPRSYNPEKFDPKKVRFY